MVNNKTVEWYYDKVTGMGLSPLFEFVLPYTDNKTVLDLGCGVGDYLQLFSKNSIGVEASQPSIEICNIKGLKVKFADLNEKLNLHDKTFDVVFCSHILEHVDSPINLLRESNRVLKDNGLIIISVPYETNLANFLGLDKYFDYHPEHISSFTIKNLLVLLDKSGFKNEKIFIDIYFMQKILKFSRPIGTIILKTIQILPKTVILSISPQYLIIGRKI